MRDPPDEARITHCGLRIAFSLRQPLDAHLGFYLAKFRIAGEQYGLVLPGQGRGEGNGIVHNQDTFWFIDS